MARARIAAVTAVWWAFVFPVAAGATADWLITQQRADGSIASSQDVAATLQSTTESVRALRLVGRTESLGAAEAFIAASTYTGTEYLARRIVVAAAAGAPTAALPVAELLSRQNGDGGFGELPGYDSTASIRRMRWTH